MLNPFRPARVEFERPGFLWVSPLAKRVLTSGQPVYIGGARGSGKTSILRTLSSREQLLSPLIQSQLPKEAFEHFSILLRVPTHLEAIAQKIFPETSEGALGELRFREFGLLLELHALQVALSDLMALLDAEGALVDAMVFTRGLKAFARDVGLVEELQAESESVDGLYGAIGARLDEVQTHIFRRLPGVPPAAEAHRPGAAVASFARNLLPALRLVHDATTTTPVRLRVCVDECEFLAQEQQKYLNAMVRASEFPVTWVIAFVPQKFDRSNTVFEGSVLSGSDRQYILLDDISDSEFEQLCQSVASMRLYYALSPEFRDARGMPFRTDFFDVQRRLGRFTLANLSLRGIDRGVRRERPDFIATAQRLGQDLLKLSSPSTILGDLDFETGETPVHLAYAMQRLGWTLPAGSDRRTIESFKAALRKKARAGFLGVCREFRVQKTPLAGYRIVLGLSDKCIRDFLNLMATLFEGQFAAGWEDEELLAFVVSKDAISYTSQRDAIHRASKQKYDDLPQHFRSNIDQGQRLIDALGDLTHELQTGLEDRTVFTLPERGIYRIDLAELDRISQGRQSVQRLEQLIRIGRVEGYLRDVNPEGGYASAEFDAPRRVIFVRLHRLLAPHFGLSYRGALHTVILPADLWLRIVEAEPFSADAWSREAVRRISEVESGAQEELPFA
jgi:hypothetical protein